MHCQQCQHENRAGARFCEACGRKLELHCAACGHLPRPGAAFCESCGIRLTAQSSPPVSSSQHPAPNTQPPSSYTPPHLAERIRAEQAAMEARGAPEGERKTITILFADIKGSMALLEDLDPEDARRLVDPALQLMIDAVHHYDGYVAQSTGDGIFALFGAPLAHEDHPQRALHAALRMQDEIRR
jgi:class 3 adenylate cyclase